MAALSCWGQKCTVSPYTDPPPHNYCPLCIVCVSSPLHIPIKYSANSRLHIAASLCPEAQRPTSTTKFSFTLTLVRYIKCSIYVYYCT